MQPPRVDECGHAEERDSDQEPEHEARDRSARPERGNEPHLGRALHAVARELEGKRGPRLRAAGEGAQRTRVLERNAPDREDAIARAHSGAVGGAAREHLNHLAGGHRDQGPEAEALRRSQRAVGREADSGPASMRKLAQRADGGGQRGRQEQRRDQEDERAPVSQRLARDRRRGRKGVHGSGSGFATALRP